ncbi:MAG: choice-of-anchor D domain-containing protein [Planctomycetota bacterium]|nr:choice-of-anchor D domain-containing protein [Planctomycetota bacterium]
MIYTPPAPPSATATWTFTNLTPGNYQVSTTWYSPPEFASNRATNAPFTISGGTPATVPVPVNQQLNPVDYSPHFSYLGSVWMNLVSTYNLTGTTLTVTLGNLANGYCLGDAILIQQLPVALPAPPPAPSPAPLPALSGGYGEAASPKPDVPAGANASLVSSLIMDNLDPGYRTSGSWTKTTGTGYAGSVQKSVAATCGDSFATWQFDGLSPWLEYQVYATWTPGADRASAATYRLFRDVTSPLSMLNRVQVNQQLAPNDLSQSGAVWELLGSMTPDRDTLSIQLTNAGKGLVVADAMMLVPVLSSVDPRMVIALDGQPLAPGSSPVDFGTTLIGESRQRTFIVRNQGNSSLTLHRNIAVPDGFDATCFAVAQLEPGQSTTFTITQQAAAAGVAQGTVSVTSNDPLDNPFVFVVRAEVVGGLQAATTPAPGTPQPALLTLSTAQRLAAAAIDRWSQTGLGQAAFNSLKALPIQVRDLPGQMLAALDSAGLSIDQDAAGLNWYVDVTPWEDGEFVAGQPPAGIDLLTVLLHEMGHRLTALGGSGETLPLGLETLPEQTRRLPNEAFFTGQNPLNPSDVDGDGMVAPIDALLVINQINANAAPLTRVESSRRPMYFDVTGDNVLSPADVLQVVNAIDQRASAMAAGEAPDSPILATPRLAASSPLSPLSKTDGSNVTAAPSLASGSIASGTEFLATGSISLPSAPSGGAPRGGAELPSTARRPRVVASSITEGPSDWESVLDLLAEDVGAAWGRGWKSGLE